MWIYLFMFALFTSLALASVSVVVPGSAGLNQDFSVPVSGSSGLFALEMTFPSGVSVVNDPSGGVLTDKYRTSYAGNYNLVLKSSSTGTKMFTNIRYTEGSGVISINDKSISITGSDTSSQSSSSSKGSLWMWVIAGLVIVFILFQQ